MDQDVKDKWVNALRSGEYLQGKHYLLIERDKKKYYCCLGVLATILEELVIANHTTSIDRVVWEKFNCKVIQDHYVDLNDQKDKSFAEIADYVEDHE